MVDGHTYLEERFKGFLMDSHHIVSIEILVLIYNTLVSKGYHTPLIVECQHGTLLHGLKQEWLEKLLLLSTDIPQDYEVFLPSYIKIVGEEVRLMTSICPHPLHCAALAINVEKDQTEKLEESTNFK